MPKDDNERIDTEGAAALILDETGVSVSAKTVANWRNCGRFEVGDWQWFSRTATTTKAKVRRFIAKRLQAEPARRRNARLTAGELPPAA